METYIPKVGDIIYVDSEWYIDDFPPRDKNGGKARIQSVMKENDHYRIVVEAFSYTTYSWAGLSEMQDYLKNKFGDTWASGGI